jgi:DNA-binding HxlR family transcriptional regulator
VQFDPTHPLQTLFSRAESEILSTLITSQRPLTRPALARNLERKSVHRALARLEPTGLIRRTAIDETDTYTINTEHVLFESLRAAHQAPATLQDKLNALMKKGWTARWTGNDIQLTGPAERAHMAGRAAGRVQDKWKEWTGQAITVHTTTAGTPEQ